MQRYIFVVFFPLAVASISFLLRKASGAFWQYADPCYIYLFNALHMIKGISVTDVSHPGTPLQVLILTICWVFNLGRQPSDVLNRVLINPEFYLSAVYIVLVFGAFLTSVFLAAYIYRKTNDRIAALLTQLPALIFLVLPSFDASYPVLPVVTNVSSESFFICVMNLFNLFFLRLYFSKNSFQESLNILLLSFVCGLGLAIKLNFLPILIVVLIVVSWRKKSWFMLFCALSFVFWTLPIVQLYPKVWEGIKQMITHTSRYGRGDEGVIDWQAFKGYFEHMVRKLWFFIFSYFFILIWSFVRLIKDYKNQNAFFLWAAALGGLLGCAATAKYFSIHYLVPSIGLSSSILFLVYFNFKHKGHQYFLKTVTIVFILIFVAQSVVQTIKHYHRLSKLTSDINTVNHNILRRFPNSTIIPTKTEDINLYLNQKHALFTGNAIALSKESDELSHLYPNSFYFNSVAVNSSGMDGYGIWDFKNRIYADDILNSYPCVIFLAYGVDFLNYPHQVSILDQSGNIYAYFLINTTEREVEDLFVESKKEFLRGNYKQSAILALKSRQLGFQPRDKIEYLLNMGLRHLRQEQSSVKSL